MSNDAIYEARWIPEEWAVEGAPRHMFVQSVLQRFCHPLFDGLKLPEGTIYASEFALGADPTQLSILDQLVSSLLGYNWSVVGFLSCTDHFEQNKLDNISRFEFIKARDFLENWIRTEGYRCLRPGERSVTYKVNLFESATWKSGVIFGNESNSPRDFYQINRGFVKVDVNETMHVYGDEIWESSNPLDFCKKVSQVH